jgi:hypothetical protein
MVEDEEDDGDLNPDVPLRPRSAEIKAESNAEIASLRRQQEHHAVHGERAVEFAEYLDRRRDRYGWNDYGAPLTLRDWDENDYGYGNVDDGEDDEDEEDYDY